MIRNNVINKKEILKRTKINVCTYTRTEDGLERQDRNCEIAVGHPHAKSILDVIEGKQL